MLLDKENTELQLCLRSKPVLKGNKRCNFNYVTYSGGDKIL